MGSPVPFAIGKVSVSYLQLSEKFVMSFNRSKLETDITSLTWAFTGVITLWNGLFTCPLSLDVSQTSLGCLCGELGGRMRF